MKRLPLVELRRLKLIKLLTLLRHKQIDPTRAQDVDYILKTVRDVGVQQGLEYRIWVQSEVEFIAEARRAARRRSKLTAILLLFTAVEHITNYYVRVFGEMRGLPEKAVDGMIARCSHDDKITWLGTLLGFSLPDKIAKQIAELRSARNKIVHFPHLPTVGRAEAKDERPDSWQKLQESVKGIALGNFLLLPENLSTHLEAIYQHAHPDYPIAGQMLEALINAKKA